MDYLLYILFFIAGATGVFLLYKYRIQKLSRQFKTKIDELKNSEQLRSLSEKKPEIHTEQPGAAENFKKTIDNLYIVNELGQRLTSSLYLQQSFQHLYTTINSMMDAAVIELSVYNELTDNHKIFSNLKNTEMSIEEKYINHISEWCYKNNREVFLTDAEKDYGRYVFQPLVMPDGRIAKSIIAFPVINRSIVTGTLCIISFQKNSFEEYHREIIRLLLGYIAVALDNALRHEELNVTKIRAEQSEKFKEQFLANMSHEIRTPINAVTGIARLLLEKQPRHDQLKYLESIRNASDSLLVIINDILDLSKIEAGKIELEKIEFSVFDLVRNVIEIMNFKVEEKGLIFNESIDEEIPPVLIGDPTRLTQILINLVGNAIKFTAKGSVTIMVSQEKENIDQPLNGLSATVASLKFEIVDSGIGMTEDQVRKLFQNYSQASSDTARKYGGTGLGLSISRQLVQLQGGSISVESVQGKGSTFSFTLTYPVSKNKSIAIREKSISKEMMRELKGIRILLADDNEYNRIVARETLLLKIENIHIDEAVDGLDAVEMVRENDYDVILMDLVMPGLDGLEATRSIRNKLPAPKNKVAIVALTASVVKSEIEKCYAAGMNGFIPKPFKAHELIGAIYKTLNTGKEVEFEESEAKEKTKMPAGSLVDLNYLIEFAEGDEIRMQRYIDLFISKTPENIKSLNEALDRKDYESIRITAHSMKPLLRSTGVNNGLELAEEIEISCINKVNLQQLPELINKLFAICSEAIEEVKTLSNNQKIN